MKLLLTITTSSELISYEALALAFFLASFDHQIQVWFKGASDEILNDTTSRVYGMVQSLALYDLPPAWADDKVYKQLSDPKLLSAIVPAPATLAPFDSQLEF